MLDNRNDSLGDRLKGYREEPDANLWSRINSELPGNSIKDQLSRYEEEPDAVTWSSIQSKIETGQGVNWFAGLSNVITALTLLGVALFYYTVNEAVQSNDRVSRETDVEEPGLTADSSHTTRSLPSGSSKGDSLLTSKALSSKSVSEISLTDKSTKRSQSTKTNIGDTPVAGGSKKRLVAINGTINNRKRSEWILSSKASPRDPIDSGKIQSDREGLSDKAYSTGLEASAVEVDPARSNIPDEAEKISLKADSSKQDSIRLLVKDQVAKIDSGSNAPKKSEKKTNGGSGLYFLVMPTFGYQQLDPVRSDNIIVESLQKISAFSTSRLGIRAEIGWEKEIAKRMVLNVGLLYFQRKQTITYNYTDPSQSEIVASDSIPLLFVSSPHQQTGTFEYELKNIGIHTGLSYEVKTDWIAHRLGLGIELQKGFSKSDLELPVSSSLYLFGNIYYRISYRISNHVDLIFQPTFNYSFKVSEQLGAPFYVKPYGLGLSVGASFRLGNR